MSYEKAKSLMEMGISKPTLFEVRLPNRKVDSKTADYLKFFCNYTFIPEVRLNTVSVSGHEYTGIVRDQPVAMVFGKPFVMTVIENSEFSVYKDIRKWFEETTINANQLNGFGRSQRMNYYNTYVEDMQLVKLEQKKRKDMNGEKDEEYREVLEVNFINAYPVGIGRVSLGSDTTDSTLQFEIEFNYESYTINDNPEGNNSRRVNRALRDIIG